MNTPNTTETAAVVARSMAVLGNRPAALLFDFDGVLSELVDDPASARIDDRAEAALHRMSRLLDVVGIVTGRAIADVQKRLDLRDLVVVGNHGLEWLVRGEHEIHEAGEAAEAAIEIALAAIRERLDHDGLLDGVIFENKRLSASVHYRMAPNRKQVASVLVPLARRVAGAHGLRATDGKLIVELRPTAEVSKGTAMRQLQQEFGLAAMVFSGDDVTDVDGFRVLKDLRSSGAVQTLAVGVLGHDTPPSVAETADVALDGVAGVADFLEGLADRLEG